MLTTAGFSRSTTSAKLTSEAMAGVRDASRTSPPFGGVPAEMFERAKAEFVGPALAGGALRMPARLIGDPLSTPICDGGEEGVRRAPDQSRLFRP